MTAPLMILVNLAIFVTHKQTDIRLFSGLM